MTKNSKTNDVDFKATLWKSADKLRNQMDAAEYKHIVLGLIFLKYISDTFDIQKNEIEIVDGLDFKASKYFDISSNNWKLDNLVPSVLESNKLCKDIKNQAT